MSTMMQLNDKYRPKRPSDMVGQKTQLADVKKHVTDFGQSKKKKKSALLIVGPTGTGKTSSIHALAKELDLEIFEVNASDVRNTEGLEHTLLPALKQQSLFSTGKIILIDEVDGLSGTGDRGGLPTIVKFIEDSAFPIILTANDVSEQKFSGLRKVCTIVEYKALSFIEIATRIKEIALKEKIDIEDDAINYLARASSGDLRGALTDLEISSIGQKKVTRKDVEENASRQREETITNALLKIFKTTNAEIALGAFENVDVDIDKLFLWVDENLPKEYTKPKDLAQAYDALSHADIYFGRIRKWQYYRYYVYIYDMLSAGVALAKKEKNPAIIAYAQSSRILKIWMANQKHMKKKAIAEKFAERNHVSIKEMTWQMPYIRAMCHTKDKTFMHNLIAEYKLDDEEVEWLTR